MLISSDNSIRMMSDVWHKSLMINRARSHTLIPNSSSFAARRCQRWRSWSVLAHPAGETNRSSEAEELHRLHSSFLIKSVRSMKMLLFPSAFFRQKRQKLMNSSCVRASLSEWREEMLFQTAEGFFSSRWTTSKSPCRETSNGQIDKLKTESDEREKRSCQS